MDEHTEAKRSLKDKENAKISKETTQANTKKFDTEYLYELANTNTEHLLDNAPSDDR